MPELFFFIGKGGVGKTTLAAAFAVGSAAARSSNREVLLISTDPAHSLGDVLEKELGDKPARVPLPGGRSLTAWEMNPAKRFQRFLAKHKRELVEVIEQGSLFSGEEISALLETTLPGMAEMAALLAIGDALESGRYARIVVDTAPFGHTLRLFHLPRQFLHLVSFLELSCERDRVLAEHFGGRVSKRGAPFIEDWRAQAARSERAFSTASLFLVTTLESFSLNESVRCLRELRGFNPKLAVRAVVLNRVVVRPGKCPDCRRRAQLLGPARALVENEYKGARVYVAEDPGGPILGARQLKKFAAHVFAGRPLNWTVSAPMSGAAPVLRAGEWPRLKAPLSFVLGKGGVGKTTVSAALAYESRARSRPAVEVCSVDPAPSLDDIFQAQVGDRPRSVLGDPGLYASELDAVALFRDWIGQIRAELEPAAGGRSGIEVDLSFERRLFSELLEIVPPGLDEVLAIFRILELLRDPSRKLVIDMAPTGHALELLGMPERILVWTRLLLKSLAAHRKLTLAREVAVKIAQLEVDARELARALRSSARATVYAVMLAELLPDRETERMLAALGKLGISAAALFVNRVLLPATGAGCQRCGRAARWQKRVFAKLQRRFSRRPIYVIRNYRHEIVGKRGLRELTGELWRLS